MPDFNAYPALSIKTVNPVSALGEVQDYQSGALDLERKKSLLPIQIQEAQDEGDIRHTQFGNSMLAQAADEALASGPDQASSVFDRRMQELKDKGIAVAGQYIGNYSNDTAKNIKSAFGGGDSGGQKADSPAKAQQQQQFFQQAAQMPPEQRSQALAHANTIIDKYKAVNNADDLENEVNDLKKSGLAGNALAGIDFSKKDKLSFWSNYQRVSALVDDLKQKRDVLQQVETNNALGFSNALPHDQKVAGNNIWDVTAQKWITPPGKRTLVKPEDTGMAPGTIGEEGDYKPLVDNTAVSAEGAKTLASKLIGSESGGNPSAQNPAAGATSGGINGMIDATYVTQARKLLPALKNVPPDQIVAMKKSGALNGLNTDLVLSQNQDDAQALQKNGALVNDATVAMAYKLGVPDATKVLKANYNMPLDQLLSKKVMDSNPQFKGQTAGDYQAGFIKQFGTNPFGGTQTVSSSKYGKFDEPKQLEYTDKDGNAVQVLAQQNKINGQWVTADGNRTPINAPNGDAKIIPAATGGGRVAMMITRALTDARDAASEMDNIVRLPISANAGIFGMRAAHGDGSLIGSAYNVLGNKLTAQESQDINATMVGMGKALAGLQTGGTAGAGGKALMDQYEKLQVQSGDSYTTAMRKIASMRQSALNAIEANMSGSFVNPAQKKQFQEAEDTIKKAVPWTPNDVTNFERAGKKNPELTFQEFAAKKGIGGVPHAGAGKPTPHVGDVQDGFQYLGGDASNHANWKKVNG